MPRNNNAPSGRGMLVLTFVVAYVLSLMPLGGDFIHLRPMWVLLVLIYWSMAIPHRVGPLVGWLCGLLLDVAYGSPLGQYALAFALVGFLGNQLNTRIRVFPLWQQAMVILLLVAMTQLIVFWVKGITGTPPSGWLYWLPSLSSMIIWPFVFTLLRGIRRQFHVN